MERFLVSSDKSVVEKTILRAICTYMSPTSLRKIMLNIRKERIYLYRLFVRNRGTPPVGEILQYFHTTNVGILDIRSISPFCNLVHKWGRRSPFGAACVHACMRACVHALSRSSVGVSLRARLSASLPPCAG